jgi:WD40 repeat protein
VDSLGDALPPGAVVRLGAPGNGQLVDYIAYSPDGRTVATAGEDISVWDVKARKLLLQVVPKERALALSFSPRGKLVVLSAARVGKFDWRKPRTAWSLQAWDPAKPDAPQTRSWESAGHPPSVAAMSADGKFLAAGNYAAVTIWYLVFIKEVRRLEMKESFQRRYFSFDTLAMSPDGSLVAGCDTQNDIALSKWLTGKAQWLPRGDSSLGSGSTAALLFSPNGKWALARRDRRLQVINPASSTWGMSFAIKDNRWSMPAISPDGRSIAVATGDFENRIELWEKITGKKRLSLAGFDPRVRSLAFSPDNRNLAAGVNDGTTLIWDLIHLPLQTKDQPEGRN